VVGVGSVGTRAYVLLLAGRDDGDPLVLQGKEAGPSALAAYCGPSAYANEGQRVVSGQRLIQASSDIFLGWERNQAVEGGTRDFYVRQLRDGKASADVDDMGPRRLEIYGELCAWTLARAHARSGDRIAIAGYLGKKETFDHAVAEYAEGYADRTESQYHELEEAVRRDPDPSTTRGPARLASRLTRRRTDASGERQPRRRQTAQSPSPNTDCGDTACSLLAPSVVPCELPS
jgi:uncharacterized protein (DUF2252 family)